MSVAITSFLKDKPPPFKLFYIALYIAMFSPFDSLIEVGFHFSTLFSILYLCSPCNIACSCILLCIYVLNAIFVLFVQYDTSCFFIMSLTTRLGYKELSLKLANVGEDFHH